MSGGSVAAKASAPARRPGLSIGSWVLYDLANTSFSLGIVSVYYPQLTRDVFGRGDDFIGTLDSLAALIVFLVAPVLGALSDQVSRRVPLLALSTMLCVGFTFLLGQEALLPGPAVFVAAVVCFQAGLIFYDSFLPVVSTEMNRGRIGGIGVGIGYAGSLVAIGLGSVILAGTTETAADFATVFRAISAVFLVAALPAFLFIRESPRAVPPLSWRVVPRAFGQLLATARRANRYRGVGRFLIGRMLYADAANTLIFMAVLYAEVSIGLSPGEARLVGTPSILAAIPSGIAWGFAVDRFGPKRTLDTVLLLWMLAYAVAAAIPLLGLPRDTIWLVGVLAGVALGGTWAADRPYMTRLSPPRYYGQFFGLYAMVGRFGAVVGPFMWGVISVTLGLGQPVAVLFLLGVVIAAFLVLRPVDDRVRAWGNDDLPVPAT